MRINQGEIKMRTVGSLNWPVFEISIGNNDAILRQSVMLDPDARRMDHVLVAKALREIADGLEQQK